ncbi:MAG: signal peptidase I [Eubacterium sp.]|jgi:signal peptidase I|nr:signal peptidase I [Eubacterium sp.]
MENKNNTRHRAKQEKMNPEEIRKEIFSWIRLIVIVVVAVVLLKQFVIVNAVVPSTSMEDTIQVGDRMIGFRLSYIKNPPKRYDIVIFNYPVDKSQKYIKRVIGLPGETVEIRDAHIYIDGSETPLVENYLKEDWIVGNDGYRFEVPEGCYLMLGDNRNISLDARYWSEEAINNGVASNEQEAAQYSYVPKDEMLGKAVFKYWPKFANLSSVEE